MQPSAVPWDFAAILVVLGVFVPWRGTARVRALLACHELASSDRMILYTSTMAFQWLAAGVTFWRCAARGVRPESLGLSLQAPTAAIALGAAMAVVLAVIQVSQFRRLAQIPAGQRGFLYELARRLMPQSYREALPFVALVCTVSVCEEFLYRGFAFAVFQGSFRESAGAAIIGSSILFAIAHLYQGRRGIASAFFLGAIFAAARFWTGSLIPGIIAHFALDIAVGFSALRAVLQAESRVASIAT